MVGGIHLVEDVDNHPLLVDDEGGAHNAHIFPSVHTLLLPHAVSLGNHLFSVGNECKVEFVLGAEVLV